MAQARLGVLVISAMLIGVPAFGAEGVVTRRSAHSVDETMNRLEQAVRARDLVVIAVSTMPGLRRRPVFLSVRLNS